MILEFKRPTKLPKDLEKRIEKLGFEYTDIVFDACIRMLEADATDEEVYEVKDLVLEKFRDSLEKAFSELESHM